MVKSTAEDIKKMLSPAEMNVLVLCEVMVEISTLECKHPFPEDLWYKPNAVALAFLFRGGLGVEHVLALLYFNALNRVQCEI